MLSLLIGSHHDVFYSIMIHKLSICWLGFHNLIFISKGLFQMYLWRTAICQVYCERIRRMGLSSFLPRRTVFSMVYGRNLVLSLKQTIYRGHSTSRYSASIWSSPIKQNDDHIWNPGSFQSLGQSRSSRQKIKVSVIPVCRASMVAQMAKNLPANAGDPGSILGWEDPLEKEMATHSSILAWRIPRTEELGGLQSMGLQRVRHDWDTKTFIPVHMCSVAQLRWLFPTPCTVAH